MKILQITSCILACLCLAACIPVIVFFGYWGIVLLGAALLFGLLMIGAKYNFKRTAPQPRTDFMNSDEENEKIRTSQTTGAEDTTEKK